LTLPDLSETLLAPDPADPAATVLELDEVWSFVLKESPEALDLARFMSGHPRGGRLLHWRPQ